MIVVEIIEEGTRERRYSDQGFYIRQVETGNLYEDAVDNIPCRFTYEETNEPIPQPEPEPELDPEAQAIRDEVLARLGINLDEMDTQS